MRRDVRELSAFYATAMGRAARRLIERKLVEAWESCRDLDMLGLGYATPYLTRFREQARRTVAAMPQTQGAEAWPAGGRNLVCEGQELRLPFQNALFDRVLVIHGLEESDDPAAYLAEVRRVMAPSGRAILAVANRRGFWAGSESTPFGHGRPFTRSQLEDVVREAGLEPTAWSRALYAPPLPALAPWAEGLEQAGSRLWTPLSGVILLEAVKQTFAVRPKGSRAPVFAPGRLRPRPAAAPVAPKTGLTRQSSPLGRKP
jgi:SAM-dependent methyltransferase